MKTKEEIRAKCFSLIQELLTFVDPDNGIHILDSSAMLCQFSAETIAAVASPKQAADGMRTIAAYLEENPNLPNITFAQKH